MVSTVVSRQKLTKSPRAGMMSPKAGHYIDPCGRVGRMVPPPPSCPPPPGIAHLKKESSRYGPLSPLSPHSPDGMRGTQLRKLREQLKPLNKKLVSPGTPKMGTPKKPITSPTSVRSPVCSPPAVGTSYGTPTSSPVTSTTPGQTDWRAVEAFTFGDPPSPTSRSDICLNAPPLGRPVRTPKEVNPSPEAVMKRFLRLVDRIIRVAPEKEKADLLPHLSVSDVIKQVVRRMNEFTDTGAARAVNDYRPVYSAYQRLIVEVFTNKALAREVRASAMVDLIGSIFDTLLAPEYCKPWVSVQEILGLKKVVLRGANPAASFTGLLLMMRQQCAHAGDEKALQMCIQELMPISQKAARLYASDIQILLKETYRFCDSHSSHWSAMCSKWTLGDDPLQPSPLGAIFQIIKIFYTTVGHTVLTQTLQGLGISSTSNLGMVVAQLASDSGRYSTS
eukprot:TRINITY_DN2974_c0_g4_i1.p1 TRINITY_DN2974_c0_g4~~TRINITY_DN2974_c0_g4_i1.p1  ORF type:complete len:448 (+),score=93.43 TRINITY_DN2974_c0_g4_i1:93-1436(+)